MASTEDINVTVSSEGGVPRNDLKIGIVSWNMGNAKSAGWETEMFPNQAAGYDIVVIGLQESTYSMSGSGAESPGSEAEATLKPAPVLKPTKARRASK